VETRLAITAVNADGDGEAAFEGRRVAVPLTIPGERVVARVDRARDGSPAVAEVLDVVDPSPYRVAPRCRHFGACGGCAWQHIAYAEQLALKRRAVERALPGGAEVLPTLPTPSPPGAIPWGYRDKVSFAFASGGAGAPLVMGHYRRGSRSVLPIDECPVHAEPGNRLAFAVRDQLRAARIQAASADGRRGVARYVVVRVSERTGEMAGTLVVTENVPALRRVTEALADRFAGAGVGFHLNLNDRPGPGLFGRQTRRLFGPAAVREEVGGLAYLVSPAAFFQTSVRAASVLVDVVIGAVAGARFGRVLDLYSGVGLFALPLAREGRRVTAVEESRDAAAGAAAARGLNRIEPSRCRIVTARVEDVVSEAGAARRRAGRRQAPVGPVGADWDAVVMDPPREGCQRAVLEGVFRGIRPARVVYVSCNPVALARDVARAVSAGYRIKSAQPIDMFPHTAHVETVVVLDRDSRPARR
jgi:23S rRNA (uracil1939-C5)-methyltransferase